MNFPLKPTTLVVAILLTSFPLIAQVNHALGYVGMRSARIWLGTDQEDPVAVAISIPGSKAPERYFKGQTQGDQGYSCIVDITDLEPGTTYNYRVFIDEPSGYASSKPYELKTQELWQFRKEAPDFTMAIGSCAFINEQAYDRPGDPYGGDYQIFDTIVKKDPDLMLWLGDNIYLREADLDAYHSVLHRYRHTRSVREIQNVMRHCPNIAIWDDHDFGPNDANGSYIHKDWTLNAFKSFWPNPSFGLGEDAAEEGITSQLQFSDVEIFLLDNRFHRTAKDSIGSVAPTILGETQLNWLLQALKQSQAPFKLIAVGGQFLNSEAVFENFANYSAERDLIIREIERLDIRGVVFLTGDRHCGELSQLKLNGGNMIYDLTVSPLTSKAYDMSKEPNKLRVEGSLTAVRHFATLGFTGKRKHRVLTMNVYDAAGKQLWSRDLPQW